MLEDTKLAMVYYIGCVRLPEPIKIVNIIGVVLPSYDLTSHVFKQSGVLFQLRMVEKAYYWQFPYNLHLDAFNSYLFTVQPI